MKTLRKIINVIVGVPVLALVFLWCGISGLPDVVRELWEGA